MAGPLTCPQCGADIGPPDDTAVRVCACPNCGETIVIPKRLPGEGNGRRAAAGTQTRGGARAFQEEAAGFPWHVKVVGALAAVFVVGLPLYVFWPRDTWERENRGRVLDLCSEADTLASGGKVAEAQQKREEVAATIGDRTLADAELRHAVARSAVVQGEAKVAALVQAGEWAEVERECGRLLDILEALPADDADAIAAKRRVSQQAREARVRFLEGEADRLAQARAYPEAITQYDRLLAYLEEQPPDDPLVPETRKRASEAKQNLELTLSQIRAEEEQRRLAEQQRREEEVRRALADARKRAARDEFLRSPAYARMRTQADSLVQSLEIDLGLEDSAWRGISKCSDAATALLGMLVQMEASVAGLDVSADVSRIQQGLDTAMIGETSALRAISKKDGAFLDLLGVWCKVLEKDHPGLCLSFSKVRQGLSLDMIGEDSAYRAQSAHLRTCTVVLRDIVAAQGLQAQADKIVSEAALDNIAETSAVRAATTNAAACMGLVLLLVEQQDKAGADTIRREVALKIIGEDSTIREHFAFKKALARGLRLLVVPGPRP